MTTKTPARPTMTTPQLVAALRARYGPPEHAFLEQVRSSTGYGPATTADGVAFSCFKSRGYAIEAFELKAPGKPGRADWLREKKKPTKADPIYQYVDRWWLVTGDDEVVKPGELPITWGWMVPAPRGGLAIKVRAPKLKPRAPTREFLASVCRNLEKAKRHMIPRDEIAHEIEAARDEAHEKGRLEGAGGGALRKVTAELEQLQRLVAAFEEASGVKLEPSSWREGNIGLAVRTVRTIGAVEALRGADHFAGQLERLALGLRKGTTKARAVFGGEEDR